jgi:hypothetical protein
VALASVGAQVWQGHLTRESERKKWLRERRSEAYIALLREFWKDKSVADEAYELMWARLNAYASPALRAMFHQWLDNDSSELRDEIKQAIAVELRAANQLGLGTSQHCPRRCS